jgi:hypothetical protein
MGLQKWVDRQLHPDSIPDSALDARLERFPTLNMSSTKLLDEFPEAKVAVRREGITVEEYRKEQQDRMRPAMPGETQSEPQRTGTPGSSQTNLQMADAMHMPNFDASGGFRVLCRVRKASGGVWTTQEYIIGVEIASPDEAFGSHVS